MMTEHFAPPAAPPRAVPERAVHGFAPAGWVALAGAVLAALGSLLAWATVDTIFGSIDVAGTNGDGVITLIAALVAAGLVVAGAAQRNVTLCVFAAIVGIVGLGVALYDWANLTSKFADVNDTRFAHASVGIGLYLCVAGFVAVVVGSFIARTQSAGPGHARAPRVWHPNV